MSTVKLRTTMPMSVTRTDGVEVATTFSKGQSLEQVICDMIRFSGLSRDEAALGKIQQQLDAARETNQKTPASTGQSTLSGKRHERINPRATDH